MELTPAELEMLKIKREQEALAKKEAELKKQTKLEADIKSARERMASRVNEDRNQIKAAQEFAGKMSGVTVKINTWIEEAAVKQYNEQNERVSVWSDNFTRREAIIVYGDYLIKVEKHITYEHYGFGRSSKDNGYKMFVSGPGIDYKSERKALSNPATAIKKITECIASIKAEKNRKEKQKSAVETTVEKMKTLYPDATVASFIDSEKNYKNVYESYDAVSIKFANGIKIKYKVYSDGSMGRKDITFPSVNNQWELMNIMNSIPASQFIKNERAPIASFL